jgi:hypothetical protein
MVAPLMAQIVARVKIQDRKTIITARDPPRLVNDLLMSVIARPLAVTEMAVVLDW